MSDSVTDGQLQVQADLVTANGVDASTGAPLLPEMTISDLAAMIKESTLDQGSIQAAKAAANREDTEKTLGLPDDVMPWDVKSAGWGVVFAKDVDEGVKREIMRLHEHRCQQIGDTTRVKVLEYAGEEDWLSWLGKYDVGPGNIYPWRVPYYLLLVGGPEQIPFEFCQMLGMEYAVGLLHFDDAKGYARYVDSVIAYENGTAKPRDKEAVFFRTSRDRATNLSAEHLVAPLADGVPAQAGEPAQPGVAANKGFATRRIWDDAATTTALSQVFASPVGGTSPAFLFSATHGVGFIQPDPAQSAVQGAIKCQDNLQFTAEALTNTNGVNCHGMIAFFFACYSAGTPKFDQFVTRTDRTPLQIADKPFLAALPKALLSHPEGGALACIGHVERAWNYSFNTNQLGDQLIVYQNAVGRILAGKPIGYALADMYGRYAVLASSVAKMLEDNKKYGMPIDDAKLVAAWAARNDAGGYVVIGDPAVCLRVQNLF